MSRTSNLLLIIIITVIFAACQKQPKADFSTSKTTAYIDEVITFTNNSSNANTFKWGFGDGETSLSENISHFYLMPGLYNANLTAYSKNGNKEDIKTITITIEENEEGTFTDIRDGKTYNTVKIGEKWWMAENLAYEVDSGCWAYENDENNVSVYGYLYDWETACDICPNGWHLPSSSEWYVLIAYLQGRESAGAKMKETGTLHWITPNSEATNTSGFNAIPGGFRDTNELFTNISQTAIWWSSTELVNPITAWNYETINANSSNISGNRSSEVMGLSVRCIKD